MRFSTALGLSVAAHAVLAAAIVGIIKWNPGPKVIAQLDLTSVELSFAEEESVEAPAVPMPDIAPVQPEPQPQVDPPPLPEWSALPDQPPDIEAMKLPDPVEDPPLLDLPPTKDPEPQPNPTPNKSAEASAMAEHPTTPNAQPPVPPAPAPKQARIDAPPAPKRTIRPEYPRGSRQRGEEGDVTLSIEVGSDGLVKSASVISSCGFQELEEAALKAVRKARFTPARSGSKPVSSTARLTLSFKLK